MDISEVRADLIAEQDALDAVVARLHPEQWTAETASPRWTVADQIGHLTYFDGTATLAIEDPAAFADHVAGLLAALTDEDATAADEHTLGEYRAMAPQALLQAWRANRAALAAASATLGDADRVTWYGPSMGSKSFLTARLMEVWAHGQDVVDALGIERADTDRIRHIAQLGFITRGWSYMNRGLDVPATPVRVELTAPSGKIWRFGPDDAPESITGPAADFCRVATQRRHVDDTDLVVDGNAAREWMVLAQAFAGPATDGPAPAKRTAAGAEADRA